MAASLILRTCARGSTPLLMQVNSIPKCVGHTVISRSLRVTPSASVVEYFRARRGPFTPEEKRGKAHLMSASTHWKVERVVAIALLGIMPAALFMQGSMADHVLTTSVYLHGFWGVESVVKDYLVKFVPWSMQLWYAIAIFGFAALVNFNFNDVGVCKALEMIWAI